MTGEAQPREVIDSDLPIFFERQKDPQSKSMVAFTVPRDPLDREAFMAHRDRIRLDKKCIRLPD